MDWERPDHCLEAGLESSGGAFWGQISLVSGFLWLSGSARQGGPAYTYVLFRRSSWHHQGFASSTLGLTEEVGYPQLPVSSGASFSVSHLGGTCSACGHESVLSLNQQCPLHSSSPGPGAQLAEPALQCRVTHLAPEGPSLGDLLSSPVPRSLPHFCPRTLPC